MNLYDLGKLRVVDLDTVSTNNIDFDFIEVEEIPAIVDNFMADIQYYESPEFQIKILGYSEKDADGWSSYDMIEDGKELCDCTIEQINQDLEEKIRVIQKQLKGG